MKQKAFQFYFSEQKTAIFGDVMRSSFHFAYGCFEKQTVQGSHTPYISNNFQYFFNLLYIFLYLDEYSYFSYILVIAGEICLKMNEWIWL